MKLPSLIGFFFGGITIMAFLWGGYFSEYDITQPDYIFRAIIIGFFVTILGYLWGRYFMTTFYKDVEQRLYEVVDEIVVKAPDVSEHEIKRLVDRHGESDDNEEEEPKEAEDN